MKRKIILIVSMLVLLAGCGLVGSAVSPKKTVENMLGKYQVLDNNVLSQLDSVIASEELSAKQKSDYEQLMRKQYQNLNYTIKDEVVTGDKAVVSVEVEVYDFAKTNLETETYVTSHESEFLGDDNKISDTLYQDYKLDRLKSTTGRIKYTIDLGLTKSGNTWKLDELSDAERQKIHGLYSM